MNKWTNERTKDLNKKTWHNISVNQCKLAKLRSLVLGSSKEALRSIALIQIRRCTDDDYTLKTRTVCKRNTSDYTDQKHNTFCDQFSTMLLLMLSCVRVWVCKKQNSFFTLSCLFDCCLLSHEGAKNYFMSVCMCRDCDVRARTQHSCFCCARSFRLYYCGASVQMFFVFTRFSINIASERQTSERHVFGCLLTQFE